MTTPRPYCYRCFKPQVVCVCGGPRVRNRTQVVVVQHPREMHHPIGTERLARLGLENCAVHVAWSCVVTPEMVPPGAALLFPSDKAREINELTDADKPSAIVAIDGTWSQARSLYRDNPWLAGIPHLKLTQAPPSNYRIRREPRVDYVSTLEAVVHALSALEPETEGFDALLDHFAGMVDRQLGFSERPPEGSYRHRRRTPRPLRPDPMLRDTTRSPVVGYVEYVAHDRAGVTEQCLVHVCVERLRDNERLELFARPVNDELPRDTHLHHMGLTRDTVEQGLDET
ncbi:MAG: DTW domain-containing protein, partial [Clostridia bacterium]|nr:DTW domain-containing protein [Deltaproteobacteria bacterium]